MTKQEFVAAILARDALILDITADSIRKRVREASAAYDVMMEELGRDIAVDKDCDNCKYISFNGCAYPCSACIGAWPDKTKWEQME